jgi:F0F1-type ATP synthase epsilon subunit
MKEFNLTIASPGKKIFEDKASELTVPGQTGWMTILAGHAPLLTTLKKGKITVTRPVPHRSGGEGASTVFTVGVEEGIMEVTKERTSVLIKNFDTDYTD